MADPRICVPVTKAYFAVREMLDPLLDGLEFKNTEHPVPPRENRDFLFESPHGIISDDLDRWLQEQRVFEFMQRHDIRSFSCDLGPSCRTYENRPTQQGPVRSLPASPVMQPDELIAYARSKTAGLRRRFSGTIKFENLNYFPTGVYAFVCEPAFIADFVTELDAELLLDLGHARVSAANLDIPFGEYLAGLPLHRVSEVHFSRAGMQDGFWEDLHEEPQDEDYAWLESVCETAEIKHVVVEYYKSPERLVGVIRRLRNLFAKGGA